MERILLIFDDPGSLKIVHRILESAGYDVITAVSGPSAMEALRTTKPGLVILDLSLPEKSRQDLCRQTRDQSNSVPLVVLSDISDVADVVLLLGLGADDYITKPFSSLEFLARVQAAIRHYRIVPVSSE